MPQVLTLTPPPTKMSDSQLAARERLKALIENSEIQLGEFDFCPSCGISDFESLSQIDRHGINCEARLCNECSVVYTTPHIASSSLPVFYNEIYGPLNFHEKKSNYLFSNVQGENLYTYVLEFLPDIKNILDIGAGTGDVVKYFAGMMPHSQVVGVEYNQDYVDQFVKTNNSQLMFGGIDEVISSNEKYDLIVLSHLFEHIVDLNEFLDKIKKISNPHTILYIEVPGIFGYFKDTAHYQYKFEHFHTIAHVYNFTMQSLCRVLGKNGFVLIKGDEKVRGLFTTSDRYSGRNHESVRISHFIRNTLPILEDSFFSKMRPFFSNNISRYEFPLKEIEMAKQLVKSERIATRLKGVENFEQKYNEILARPYNFIALLIWKKICKKFFGIDEGRQF